MSKPKNGGKLGNIVFSFLVIKILINQNAVSKTLIIVIHHAKGLCDIEIIKNMQFTCVVLLPRELASCKINYVNVYAHI